MPTRIRAFALCGSLAMCPLALAGGISPTATTIVLDASDVVDWARVSFSYHWKDQDAILHPYALLKFDLSDVPLGAQVVSASLHFNVESTQAGGTVGVYHVANDAWNFLNDTPATLHAWPIHHLIQSYATGTTGWKVIPVTAEVAGEAAGDRVLSIKWEDGFQYLPERITSPSSLDSRHRPFLRVAYASVLPVGNPDFTLGPCDIRPSDVTPTSGQLLSIAVTAHNVGSLPASNVVVRLYDGDPTNGVVLGAGTIANLPAGGGTGTVTIATIARPGRHRLTAVVDPDDVHGESDEGNNVAFSDLAVLSRYDQYAESFEQGTASGAGMVVWHGGETGLSDWISDADVPFDPNIGLARRWRIMRTRTEAYDGHQSLAMEFDGRSDDGTVWIERWIQVDPNTEVTVDLKWAFGIVQDIATTPAYFIGTYDPEVESDFSLLPLQNGWIEYNASKKLKSGECGKIWVAVGFTVTWETPVEHFLDAVEIAIH